MSLYTFDKRIQRIITELAEKHKIHPMDAAEMIIHFEKDTREFLKNKQTIRVPNFGIFFPSKHKEEKIKQKQLKFKNNENSTK